MNILRDTARFTRFNWGNGKITGQGVGTVSVDDRPARRRIFCFDWRRTLIVRDCWSASDGTYELPQLDTSKTYLIMAIDHKGQYEPIAYDGVKPHEP